MTITAVIRCACAAIVSAAMVGVSACTFDLAPDQIVACPSARVAVPSDQIGHSDEQGRIRFVAKIEQLTSDCRIEDEKLTVDLAFDVRAERGPALQDTPVRVTYYVATVDPNREIIDKKLLNVVLEFEPAQAESAMREEVTMHLPLPTDAGGANYNLYLGFQPEA